MAKYLQKQFLDQEGLDALVGQIKAADKVNADAIAAEVTRSTEADAKHTADIATNATNIGKVAQDLVTEAATARAAEEANAAAAKAAQDDVDALAAKVGEVPEDKTVVQMIEDAQTAATYDDTEVRGLIKDNADAIAAINNEETGILAQAKAHADGKDAAIEAAKKAGDDAQADVDALAITVASNATAAKVTLTTAETATEGYLKTYVIAQGETEVGKIDIPKELVVTAGEVVVNPEGQPEGTYIKLTIANQEAPIFINVKDLVDAYTAQAGAAEIQLAISETNEISATIVDGAVTTAKIADASVTRAKIDAEFEADIKALEEAIGEGGSVDAQIDAKIAELDADVTSAAVEEGKGLQVQVVEVDGKITTVAVTGNYDNAYEAKGAAATAKDEAIAAAATDAQTKADAAQAAAEATAQTKAETEAAAANAAITAIDPDSIAAMFAPAATE